jgi:hypothetical protein
MLVRTCRIHVDAARVHPSDGSVDRVDHLSDAYLLDRPAGCDIVGFMPAGLALPDLDRQADSPDDRRSQADSRTDRQTNGQADRQTDGHGAPDRHGTSDRDACAATSGERGRPPRASLQRRGRADLRHGWPRR